MLLQTPTIQFWNNLDPADQLLIQWYGSWGQVISKKHDAELLRASLGMIRELEWAAFAIVEMQAAADFDRYEKAWLDYLHYLDRGSRKLEKNLASVNQQKLSHARQTRKSDALLSYLMHARNVDQHTIQPVVVKHPGSLKIIGGLGGGTIHRGVFSGDGQVSHLVYEGSLDFNFVPERMEIIEVNDRGVFYDVPTSHLNVPLKSFIPHYLAQLALDHYKSLVNDH